MRDLKVVVKNSKTWKELLQKADIEHGWEVEVRSNEVSLSDDNAQYTFTKTESLRKFLQKDRRCYCRPTGIGSEWEVYDRVRDGWFLFSCQKEASSYIKSHGGF